MSPRSNLAFAAGRIASGLINFLALAIYTRVLEPREYGEYAVALAAVLLLQAILFQWLRLGVVRFASIYPEEELFATLRFGFALLCLVSAPLVCLSHLAGIVNFHEDLLWYSLFLLIGQAWHELNLEAARSRIAPSRYLFMSVVRSATSLAIGWPLAAAIGAPGALIGMVGGNFFSTIFGPLSRRAFQLWSPGTWRRLSEFFAYGFPLSATVSLATVILTIDRFVLAAWSGPDAVGLYSVGYDLAQQSLGVLMLSVNLGTLPLVMRSALGERNPEKTATVIRQHSSLLFFVAVPTTIAMSLLAKDLTHLALGEQFSDEAATVLPWIAFGSLAAGLKAFYFDLPFQISGRSIAQLLIGVTTAAMNVSLVWLLVPPYGTHGAAAAMAGTFTFSAILTWLVGRRIHPLPTPGRDLITFSLASLPMAAVLVASQSENVSIAWLLLRVCGGGIAFLVSVRLLDPRKLDFTFRLGRTSPLS